MELSRQVEKLELELAELKAELNAKSEFWEPKDGEEAWWVNSDGHIEDEYDCYMYKSAIAQGSIFQTRELAQAESDLRVAKYRLKKRIFELNDGWKPKFNISKYNHYILLNVQDLIIFNNAPCKIQPSWMYLKSEELAKQLISEMKDELLLVLGE